MQVGDRVMVKASGERGYIDGEADSHKSFGHDWLIRCDDGSGLNVCESELLPIEVVVLEGAVTFEFDNGLVVGGTSIGTVIDHGDEARLTIERVKKEALPDETP